MSQLQDKNTIEVGEGYRKLGDDEIVQRTDERVYEPNREWESCSGTSWVGKTVREWRAYNEYSANLVVRRKHDSTNETAYQNTLDSMIRTITILQPSDNPGLISVQLKCIELIRSQLDILEFVLKQLNR